MQALLTKNIFKELKKKPKDGWQSCNLVDMQGDLQDHRTTTYNPSSRAPWMGTHVMYVCMHVTTCIHDLYITCISDKEE